MQTVARSLSELLAQVERHGRGALEYRGRVLEADAAGLHARFVMADGLEGCVSAAWPSATGQSESGRAALLHALNSLIQRCGMFETCERAYVHSYGRRTA